MGKLRIAIFLAFFFLSACQQPSTPEPTVTPTPIRATKTPLPPTLTPTPVKTLEIEAEELKGIEIDIWHAWFGAPAALLNAQIADFNKENPWGIKVSATYQGSYNMLFNAVTDSLDTEKRPQIVVALVDQTPMWRELGAVKDLTPYIDDPLWGMTTAEKTDIPSVFLAQDQRGKEQIALPAQRTARFLLYNKTWGKELGFTSPPMSFDEFEEQACAANRFMRTDEDLENDGKGGWIIDSDSFSVLAWMRGFGGGALVDDKYKFKSSENINALKSLKTLYDNQCAWLSTADTHYEQFAIRSALFISASMEEFNDIKRQFAETGSRDEWTIIPFPGEERNAFITYGTSYTLLETEDAEALASWLFVKWMLTAENQAKWTKSTALYPLSISSLDALSDYERTNPQWAEAVNLLSQAEIQPQGASWHTVRYLLGDGFEYIFRFNTKVSSIDTVLAEMDSTAHALSE